jgi:YHS domain-containing protein
MAPFSIQVSSSMSSIDFAASSTVTGPGLWRSRLARVASIIVFGSALVAAGCAPLVTQNPGGKVSPANVVSEGEDKHLMLAGHDVVSYFTDGRHQLGDAAIKSVYEGVTFRFASAEHKQLFDAEPARYVPMYGGYCANGIVYAIPWGGDADTWTIYEGRLYIFGGKGSMDAFLLDKEANIKLAEKYWGEEVQGSNALFQRLKRLTMKVDHYKSGKELADMVAAAKAR